VYLVHGSCLLDTAPTTHECAVNLPTTIYLINHQRMVLYKCPSFCAEHLNTLKGRVHVGIIKLEKKLRVRHTHIAQKRIKATSFIASCWRYQTWQLVPPQMDYSGQWCMKGAYLAMITAWNDDPTTVTVAVHSITRHLLIARTSFRGVTMCHTLWGGHGVKEAWSWQLLLHHLLLKLQLGEGHNQVWQTLRRKIRIALVKVWQ